MKKIQGGFIGVLVYILAGIALIIVGITMVILGDMTDKILGASIVVTVLAAGYNFKKSLDSNQTQDKIQKAP